MVQKKVYQEEKYFLSFNLKQTLMLALCVLLFMVLIALVVYLLCSRARYFRSVPCCSIFFRGVKTRQAPNDAANGADIIEKL